MSCLRSSANVIVRVKAGTLDRLARKPALLGIDAAVMRARRVPQRRILAEHAHT
jgi:hypothetical protein